MKSVLALMTLVFTLTSHAATVSDRTVVTTDSRATSIYLYGTKGSQAAKLFDALNKADEEEASGSQGASHSRIRTGKDIECSYEYAPSRSDIKFVYGCTIRVNASGDSTQLEYGN